MDLALDVFALKSIVTEMLNEILVWFRVFNIYKGTNDLILTE